MTSPSAPRALPGLSRVPCRALAVLMGCLLLASCSMIGLGGPTPVLELLDHGIYSKGQLTMKTNGVPRDLGVTFGMRFKVIQAKDAKDQPAKARIVTRTPGLMDPAKQKIQMDFVSETALTPGQTYEVFFTFSERWEMVSGQWELTVETDKGETLTQSFDVYTPKY